MKIIIIMLLLHIIDDFVFQGVCLNKLKQKEFWKDYVTEDNQLYKNDYIVALFIHGLSWSIMIHLPFFFFDCSEGLLLALIIIQAIVHSFIDNLKANAKKINLVIDQICHFVQILLSYIFLTI